MESPHSPASPSALQAELHQTRPFRSTQQEALLSIQRTASLIERVVGRLLEPEGVSSAQYNVLRILRGAGPEGLPTLAIRGRMIDPGAAITRLVDRLEGGGLVTRARGTDRRMVHCRITPAGLELLDRVAPRLEAAEQELAGGLPDSELRSVIDLLAHLRSSACDGKREEDDLA